MQRSNVTPINKRSSQATTEVSNREFRDQIVGKTITAVVAKPGRAGQPPMVLMMQFDDGSVVEWVSPRSDAVLRRAIAARPHEPVGRPLMGQECLQLPLMGGSEYHRA